MSIRSTTPLGTRCSSNWNCKSSTLANHRSVNGRNTVGGIRVSLICLSVALFCTNGTIELSVVRTATRMSELKRFGDAGARGNNLEHLEHCPRAGTRAERAATCPSTLACWSSNLELLED
eukprot:3537526-Rhodomonas_salina.1